MIETTLDAEGRRVQVRMTSDLLTFVAYAENAEALLDAGTELIEAGTWLSTLEHDAGRARIAALAHEVKRGRGRP